ncbi:DUF3800 domain-containing protein [bacterium]|nr:DUF3800 domain-containing protein [bacterium]
MSFGSLPRAGHVKLYLDESGTLGYSGEVFTMAIVLVHDLPTLETSVAKHRVTATESKASQMRTNQKLGLARTLFKENDIKVLLADLDPRAASVSERKLDKDMLYDSMAGQALAYYLQRGDLERGVAYRLSMDIRGSLRESYEDLVRESIGNLLIHRADPLVTDIDVRFLDSKFSAGVQVADLFSNIYRTALSSRDPACMNFLRQYVETGSVCGGFTFGLSELADQMEQIARDTRAYAELAAQLPEQRAAQLFGQHVVFSPAADAARDDDDLERDVERALDALAPASADDAAAAAAREERDARLIDRDVLFFEEDFDGLADMDVADARAAGAADAPSSEAESLAPQADASAAAKAPGEAGSSDAADGQDDDQAEAETQTRRRRRGHRGGRGKRRAGSEASETQADAVTDATGNEAPRPEGAPHADDEPQADGEPTAPEASQAPAPVAAQTEGTARDKAPGVDAPGILTSGEATPEAEGRGATDDRPAKPRRTRTTRRHPGDHGKPAPVEEEATAAATDERTATVKEAATADAGGDAAASTATPAEAPAPARRTRRTTRRRTTKAAATAGEPAAAEHAADGATVAIARDERAEHAAPSEANPGAAPDDRASGDAVAAHGQEAATPAATGTRADGADATTAEKPRPARTRRPRAATGAKEPRAAKPRGRSKAKADATATPGEPTAEKPARTSTRRRKAAAPTAAAAEGTAPAVPEAAALAAPASAPAPAPAPTAPDPTGVSTDA